MTYARQLADDKLFRYLPDLVWSLHYTMTNYDLARHPGRWRPGPVRVSVATEDCRTQARDDDRLRLVRPAREVAQPAPDREAGF